MMKLLYSPFSPFARKVRVVIIESGLSAKVELVELSSTPVTPNPGLQSVNPLVKIPSLVLQDGTALYDSRVIAEYLDALNGPVLFPSHGPARWNALRRQALSDGLQDAAIAVRYEITLRPEKLQFKPWIDGQMAKIRNTLAILESEAGGLADTYNIGTIAIGCALGYLDVRFADEAWQSRHPKLASFWRSLAERPAFQSTKP